MDTSRVVLRVDRREINYLRTTIESYDGMAMVRTLEPLIAHIELMIAPGCESLVFELLDSIQKVECLKISK